MAYAKQAWTNDDPATPVSAARLTHIEDGIAAIELTPGPEGAKGPSGKDGAKGPKGDPGKDGAKGAQGDPGKDGFGTETQYNDIISRLEALETPA